MDGKDALLGRFASQCPYEAHLTTAANGIVERFHRTVLSEFYRVAFCRKISPTIDELQRDLDLWLREYNEVRPHQGRWCYGKTPLQTFIDGAPLAREKILDGGQEGLA